MWVVLSKIGVRSGRKWVLAVIGVGALIGIAVSVHRFTVDRWVWQTATRIERKVDKATADVASGVNAARLATESFRRKGCGEFRYRVGDKCVDARDRVR